MNLCAHASASQLDEVRARIDKYIADTRCAEVQFQNSDVEPQSVGPLGFFRLHLKQFRWTICRVLGRDPSVLRPNFAFGKSFLLPALWPTAPSAPRILVDVTYSALFPWQTGIQRAVREFARQIYLSGKGQPILVGNALYLAYSPRPRSYIDIEEGDIFLSIDSNWKVDQKMLDLLNKIKNCKGKLVVFIHDIIPIKYPGVCEQQIRAHYCEWLHLVALQANAILTSTIAVARDIRSLESLDARFASIPIGVCAYGFDFAESKSSGASADVTRLNLDNAFLSVGTIEPRKGLSISLDAVESLWSKGVSVSYFIVGRSGWNMKHFEQRLLNHKEYGTRLFWLNDATDGDLDHLYRNVKALVSASVAEGFGLPIVEAGHVGLPVILSDIPAHQEIASWADATFYRVADSAHLASKMEDMMIGHADRKRIRETRTWADFTLDVSSMLKSPALYEATGDIVDVRTLGLEIGLIEDFL